MKSGPCQLSSMAKKKVVICVLVYGSKAGTRCVPIVVTSLLPLCELNLNTLRERCSLDRPLFVLLFQEQLLIRHIVPHHLMNSKGTHRSSEAKALNDTLMAETTTSFLNDKIHEVINENAANRDKYIGVSSSGIIYKSGSALTLYSSGSYQSNGKYEVFGSRDVDRLDKVVPKKNTS
ncbi:hypothetical protein VNO77_18720 [Canavalia gladiata]|uniref:Uncharacterized protein n=1 Tax=Canavalia gladiata TaxID=3824 RepID=A0AAN9QHX7_CANGL